MTTVLVVDDSEALCRILALTLTRAGHAGAYATSPSAAIEAAAATPPEVVFIDLHIGDSSGADLAATLRGAVPRARLICLSGELPPPDLHDQFDSFLLKPVDVATLLGAVDG